MPKLVIITALLTSLCCGIASAQYVSTDVNPSSLGSIVVKIYDGAQDACWTNFREVREYTEEKLRLANYSVNEDQTGSRLYTLDVSVDAFRNGGRCFGTVSIQLTRPAEVEGVFGFLEVASSSAFAIREKNLNSYVITRVQKIINKM